MALPLINIGTGVETGDGDELRIAFGKANAYFTDHETRISANTVTLNGLGSAATRNVGTATGTVADGGALQSEITRAQAAEALLAPLASPAFTGTPTAPTATSGDNSTALATTAFVQSAVAGGGVQAVLYGSSQSLSLAQQSTARGNIGAAASGNNTDISSLAGPSLGAATAATAPAGSNTSQVANTAFVATAIYNYNATVSSYYAPLASPNFSGTVTFATGSGPYVTAASVSASTHAVSRRAGFAIGDWLLAQDSNGNGTKDFFVYSGAAGVPLSISTAGVATFLFPPFAPDPAAGDNSPRLATTSFLASNVARTDIAQSLTPAQLTQARANLFVPDISAMQGHSLLINGFHNVSQQYGTTATAIASSTYSTDQWQIFQTGTMASTFQQVQGPFPSQPDIPNGLKISITTAQAVLGAGDYIMLSQPLEGTNLARLNYGSANAKTVTLAWMIRPSIALTGYVSLFAGGSNRTIAQRFTAAANTDTFVYLTIPGDTAQTLLLTNALSLQVRWCFGTGATYQGTANTWSGNNVLAASDVTNLAATVGNNVVISGAVMLPGVIPISQSMLPLLARRYDDELRLCQRYYETGNGLLQANASGTLGVTHAFKVPKRNVGSVALTQGGNNNVQSFSASTVYPDSFTVQITGNSGAAYSYYTFAANARM
jgi:hypothetical protein